MKKESSKVQKIISVILIILTAASLSGVGYVVFHVLQNISNDFVFLENQIFELGNKNLAIVDTLKQEQKKNSEFSNQIGNILGTVNKLDKLSKTDKELLQKYSKIYFLNENYIPEDLTNIPPDYIAVKDKEIKMHARAYSYLQEMIVAAAQDGFNLKIISAYRSFGEQSSLKNAYTVTYGSGANKFSADQGYSEHQLGTALDFSTAELGLNFTNFKNTEEYKWLLQNAYKYGFVISYPENNKYYQFEPWHWRFVGKSLARMLHEENKNFYEVDQRVIDNYLINIFD